MLNIYILIFAYFFHAQRANNEWKTSNKQNNKEE